MKTNEQLDNQLNQLGKQLRAQPSVVEQGLSEIRDVDIVKAEASFYGIRLLFKPGISVAACLLVSLCVWFLMTTSSPVTLADVKGTINTKPWIHLQYDDGAKEWANLKERRSFYTCSETDDRDFYAGMRDHTEGVWRYYHSNWGQQIHEKPFVPRTYPQTAWEYAVGDWDNRGPVTSQRKTIETFTDALNGQDLVRFDTYDVGPAGLRSLVHQVWVDPETHLPIRIHKNNGPNQSSRQQTADFSFPDTGPNSIYELGAPRGLPVVANWGVIDPEAQVILDRAKQAWHELPRQMRIITKSQFGMSISYRMGDQFRNESYMSFNSDHTDLVARNYPREQTDWRAWAAEHLTAEGINVFDQEYDYKFYTLDASLSIQRHDKDWIHVCVPIRDQWPYINNVGPMTVLPTEPNLPDGCVLLRYERTDLRRDWVVDTQRDFICLEQHEYDLDEATGLWRKSGDFYVERTDLIQLSSGQWYAGTVSRPERMNGSTRYEVTLLTEKEMEQQLSKDTFVRFFDGEQLIKQAKESQATISFWGR